eukprot:RCo024456
MFGLPVVAVQLGLHLLLGLVVGCVLLISVGAPPPPSLGLRVSIAAMVCAVFGVAQGWLCALQLWVHSEEQRQQLLRNNPRKARALRWLCWRETLRCMQEVASVYIVPSTEPPTDRYSMVTMLSRLSHELNTSLQAILGAVQVISPDRPDPELIAIISHSARVMANLVSDFLDLAQCQQGKLTLSVRAFQLGHLLEKLQGVFSGEAQRLGIALEFVVHPSTPAVISADANRVKQVLTHLLCNAIQAVHATASGRVLVTVAGVREDQVEFSVTDNGAGIAEEEQHGLFEPFYRRRGSAVNTRGAPGCGLGLCLCSHLVRLMGGSLELHSDIGMGTHVSFTLPVAPPSASPSEDPLLPVHGSAHL